MTFLSAILVCDVDGIVIDGDVILRGIIVADIDGDVVDKDVTIVVIDEL